MGCNGCSSRGGSSSPNGCRNNGTCGTDGCNYLTVFNWLGNMKLPSDQPEFDCFEIRFKNGRKAFYHNVNNLKLNIGDVVAVESSPGHDIGAISLKGELVRIQMSNKGVRINDPEMKRIYRKATQRDIDTWKKAIDREHETMLRTRQICNKLNLNMKVSDVEYQGDNSKATFFYTADDRVDFRQLIKELASSFGIRVEMRQIGLRQEAARVGGLGSCGRELCCTTWLTDFRSVNTAAARYQQLSLNPQKLAGQCGKLKCCLNYELDSYLDALDEFPDTSVQLRTEKGNANFQKLDVFKKELWYAYEKESINWIKLSVDSVHYILELNRRRELVASLEELEEVEETPISTTENYSNVVGQDDLTRFDKPKKRKKPSRRKKPSGQKSGASASERGSNGAKPSRGRKPAAKAASENVDARKGGREEGVESKGRNRKPRGNRPAAKRNGGAEQKQQSKEGAKRNPRRKNQNQNQSSQGSKTAQGAPKTPQGTKDNKPGGNRRGGGKGRQGQARPKNKPNKDSKQ